MTPKECAEAWWKNNELCRNFENREPDMMAIKLDLPVKTRLKKDVADLFKMQSHEIAQAQSRFDACQWTEYSQHCRRISDEIYGKSVSQ